MKNTGIRSNITQKIIGVRKNQCKMFFGYDLKLQTGCTEISEPALIIFPFCLALMRQVHRWPVVSDGLPWVVSTGKHLRHWSVELPF